MAKGTPYWEVANQRPRRNERNFSPSVNGGQVVPEIDIMVNNPDQYKDLQYLTIPTDQASTLTAKQIRNRNDKIRNRKGGLVLYTRNELVEDPSKCPRRAPGGEKARRLFEECVAGTAIWNDAGWFRCCDCSYFRDNYTAQCRVRPRPEPQGKVLSNGIQQQVAEQNMSQSETSHPAFLDMEGKTPANGHTTQAASRQSVDTSMNVEVENKEDEDKADVKAEVETEDKHDIPLISQQSSDESHHIQGESQEPSTHHGLGSQDMEDHPPQTQPYDTTSPVVAHGPTDPERQWRQASEQLLQEAEARHEEELQRVRQEATENMERLFRYNSEGVAKFKDDAHNEHLSAVVELSMNSANKIADLDAQMKGLKDGNNKLKLKLESESCPATVVTGHKAEGGVQETQHEDLERQLEEYKAELAKEKQRNNSFAQSKDELVARLTAENEEHMETKKQHAELKLELTSKLEAATKKIQVQNKEIDEEKKKAHAAKAALTNQATFSLQRMRALWNQSLQQQKAASNAEVEKVKKEAKAQQQVLRETMRKEGRRENATLIDENKRLKETILDLRIELAEKELLTLKQQDERYSKISAKEGEIAALNEKKRKRAAVGAVQERPLFKRARVEN